MAAIRFEGVHKRYRVYRQRYRSLKDVLLKGRMGDWEDRWALRGVSFAVERGGTLGLIGPNGAGKSTAMKLMARILVPNRGRVEVDGRVGALIELGAGFHPDYTGRENVFLNASLLGLSGAEIRRRFEAIAEFSELGPAIDLPLRTYSSGMAVRLGFSVAVHVDPEVLLLDEILAVGDESFQRKCFDYIDHFKRAGGTIVFISHSMDAIRQVCAEAAWIDGGELRGHGSADEVVQAYMDRVRESWESAHPAGAATSEAPDIEIGMVELRDGASTPAESFRTGGPMTVRIPYRVHRPVDEPVFGVSIHRADGVQIFATNTQVDGCAAAGLKAEGHVSLTYPKLELLGGSYRVSVGVFGSGGRRPIDLHDQRYHFRVKEGKGHLGAVMLDRKWSFER